MSEVMEKYADWLDQLEKTDPDQYQKLIGELRSIASDGSMEAPDMDTFAEVLSKVPGAPKTSTNAKGFEPVFPGDRVMGANGLDAKQEAIEVDVTPGFVLKTTNTETGMKVFINFCHTDKIKNFSKKVQLDENGNEQEGISIPLSMGPSKSTTDRAGNTCIAYDVAVNPQVLDDAKDDKSGTFRNFLCQLAIEYVEKKFKVQLNPQYKLPKLVYRGKLPPPMHRIRKSQTPVIEDISSSSASSNRTPNKKKTLGQAVTTSKVRAEAVVFQIFSIEGNCTTECLRTPTVEGGEPLSEKLLDEAPSVLRFVGQLPKLGAEDVADLKLQMAQEYLTLRAPGYFDLDVFLPYPVRYLEGQASFCKSTGEIIVNMPVNRRLELSRADVGSNPWMLAQALDFDESNEKPSSNVSPEHRFHLNTSKIESALRPRIDPVKEEDALPEDKFHRGDMMSQHILDQRQQDKADKARRAEEDRKMRKAENDHKMKKAKEAGKTWAEMYPGEPATSYIDLEEIAQKQKQEGHNSNQEDEECETYVPTETALQAAAAWAQKYQSKEDLKKLSAPLSSSLAFELLD